MSAQPHIPQKAPRRISRLKATALDIIDWPDLKKAQMVYTMSGGLGLYMAALLCVIYACLHLSSAHTSNDFVWLQASVVATVYGLLCLFMSKFGNRYSAPDAITPKGYINAALMMFTTGNILALVYAGIFSLGAGLAMSGGPIIGMLLFDKRDVIFPLSFGCFISVAWYALTYIGIVEYALVLDDSSVRHLNTAWLVMCLGGAIPQLFCVVYIAWVSIDRWRTREYETLVLAQTDALTQLPNRRYFLDELNTNITQLPQQAIGLIMLDLDHFKQINDTYTHPVGDQVLVEAVNTLKTCLPNDALMSRHGGEEFCIMLSNVTIEYSHDLARLIRQAIEQHTFAVNGVDGPLSLHVTTSLGVYHWANESGQKPSASDILKAADDALYQAKRNGRNKAYCSKHGDIAQCSHHTHEHAPK